MEFTVYKTIPGYKEQRFDNFEDAFLYFAELCGKNATFDHTCGLPTGVCYSNADSLPQIRSWDVR